MAEEIFRISIDELGSILNDAEKFLAEFLPAEERAARLAELESDGRLLKPGEGEWSLYTNLLGIQEQQLRCKWAGELLKNKLKLTIGGADGLDGVATWKTESRQVPDLATFRIEHPDLYQSYLKRSQVRKFRLE